MGKYNSDSTVTANENNTLSLIIQGNLGMEI